MAANSKFLDPTGILRLTDSQTIQFLDSTTGTLDFNRSDFVQITGNGAVLTGTQRAVDVGVGNNDATVTQVHMRIGTKNGVMMLPRIATANRAAASAAINGGIYYDTTTNKVVVVENGAYANVI